MVYRYNGGERYLTEAEALAYAKDQAVAAQAHDTLVADQAVAAYKEAQAKITAEAAAQAAKVKEAQAQAARMTRAQELMAAEMDANRDNQEMRSQGLGFMGTLVTMLPPLRGIRQVRQALIDGHEQITRNIVTAGHTKNGTSELAPGVRRNGNGSNGRA